MSVDSPLSSINESILAVGTLVGLSLQLPVSSLKRNPRRGLIIAHPKVRGLGVELMFNKNIIKLGDDVKYIKKTADAIVILCTKQRCDCKDNVLAHLKASLNQTTKIKSTEVIKLLCSWYKVTSSNPEIYKVC